MKKQIEAHNNGAQSTDIVLGSKVCFYRAPDGNRCFGGCFIPDSLYCNEMEQVKIAKLPGLSDVLPLSPKGMQGLQNIHDRTEEGDIRVAAYDWIDDNVEDS